GARHSGQPDSGRLPKRRPHSLQASSYAEQEYSINVSLCRGEFPRLTLVGDATGRRKRDLRCSGELHRPNLMFPAALQPARRELTPVLCSVRLSWRRWARPSATLHEIQICANADWNNSVVTQSPGGSKLQQNQA